ncbi:DNA-binding transcriptional regulator, AcrR family [Lentzea waywayandensis]|uniref:DNA-binding transcriptional regulator, AcrR family n=1 Tax=Lentzea waywayandensis TaxID=84724 RepID=A0A1I6FE95_9PSEU|nr:TetR/AcrR family transcriptional regulator [Lentzea waywayandensis]SFR28260.1 DNA-binding transcriptional regulator, AcrR family [Lentzea waywayandensis]
MPKRVDHEEKRRDLAEALFRIASTRGLQSVTLRAVAAEAGVSMFQIQYYFPTKEEMLRHAWQRITELGAERAGHRITEAMRTGDERAVMRACLLAVLPTDERSRVLCAVQIAYFALDVTRGGQSPDQQAMMPFLVRLLVDQLGLARKRDRVPPHLDLQLEADALATMTGGLLSAMLVDVYDAKQAEEIVDYRLGQLFGSEAG